MSRLYYWENEELKTAKGLPDVPKWCFALDTGFEPGGLRYGKMSETGYWVEGSYASFPTEFKMNLLLLGVT